jgi:hypothetical protein
MALLLPCFAGGSATSLSATDAYGQSLGLGDALLTFRAKAKFKSKRKLCPQPENYWKIKSRRESIAVASRFAAFLNVKGLPLSQRKRWRSGNAINY